MFRFRTENVPINDKYKKRRRFKLKQLHYVLVKNIFIYIVANMNITNLNMNIIHHVGTYYSISGIYTGINTTRTRSLT